MNRAAPHAHVYLAITSRSEADSGSDYRRLRYVKENYDQEILGVFFSLALANDCARSYVEDELGRDLHDEEEEEEEEEEDDLDDFVWDGSDEGIYEEDSNSFRKVWVECRAIEDATPRFRP